MEELTNQVDFQKADSEVCEQKFTAKVFVVLRQPKMAFQVENDTGNWRLLKKYAFCMNNEDRWCFERAPEPSDIFYENLGVGSIERAMLIAYSYFITAIVIGICVACIGSLKSYQREYIKDAKANKTLATTADQVKTQIISGSVTMLVVVVNYLLQFVIRRLSMHEKHETSTKMNVSIALKLTLARFLNSSVVLTMVNKDPELYYTGGNLAYDASMLLFIMAFQVPTMDILNIPTIIKKLKIAS